MDLGGEIKRQRYLNNIDQKTLAKELGITNTHLSSLESNKHSLTISMLTKIGEIFNIPIAVIVFNAMDAGDVSPENRKKFRESKHSIACLMATFYDSKEKYLM